MFNWFQSLLPRKGDFFGMFEAHAATVVAAANALGELANGHSAPEDHLAEINRREHEADNIIREVLRTVRQTFLTPFDRNAIVGLIGAMDDVVDEIQACASAIELYSVSAFEPEMKSMAGEIVAAVKLIDEALPLLRQITRSGQQLHALTARIVAMEGQVDLLHAQGLKANFARAQVNGDTVQFIVVREIYKHLEKISDAFEDVANHIDGLTVDHA